MKKWLFIHGFWTVALVYAICDSWRYSVAFTLSLLVVRAFLQDLLAEMRKRNRGSSS